MICCMCHKEFVCYAVICPHQNEDCKEEVCTNICEDCWETQPQGEQGEQE
jgi:hypothetical protein